MNHKPTHQLDKKPSGLSSLCEISPNPLRCMTVVLFPIYILISLNTKKKNEYIPFVWLDDTDENAEVFGLQSYV